MIALAKTAFDQALRAEIDATFLQDADDARPREPANGPGSPRVHITRRGRLCEEKAAYDRQTPLALNTKLAVELLRNVEIRRCLWRASAKPEILALAIRKLMRSDVGTIQLAARIGVGALKAVELC